MPHIPVLSMVTESLILTPEIFGFSLEEPGQMLELSKDQTAQQVPLVRMAQRVQLV
jgi:hypothetical protein